MAMESSWLVWCRCLRACGWCGGLDRALLAEHPGCRSPSGDRAAEVEGVHADPFAVTAPGPAGWSGQVQGVRLAVACGPFTNHVVDDHALVLLGSVDRDSGGAADVEAVHQRGSRLLRPCN